MLLRMLTGLVVQHIFDSVKQSLQRLQLDYIDVLQCKRRRVSCIIEPTLTMQFYRPPFRLRHSHRGDRTLIEYVALDRVANTLRKSRCKLSMTSSRQDTFATLG